MNTITKSLIIIILSTITHFAFAGEIKSKIESKIYSKFEHFAENLGENFGNSLKDLENLKYLDFSFNLQEGFDPSIQIESVSKLIEYDDGINSAIQVCKLLDKNNKKMSEILAELPTTYQSPTMAPYCKDSEKYEVVENLVKEITNIKENKTKVDDQEIKEILTVNGVRFSFDDGSWGLIRASSNKPSLVVVTESPTSEDRKKKIFDFIDNLLQQTGKVGDYDQKI